MKLKCWTLLGTAARRAPRGARGLKPLGCWDRLQACRSRPARGAWIETMYAVSHPHPPWSRPARGAWIETRPRMGHRRQLLRRAPRGARGLKHHGAPSVAHILRSRPARGAWIETGYLQNMMSRIRGRAPRGARGLKPWRGIRACRVCRRAPRGARGLKLRWAVANLPVAPSRPARGAWIETSLRPAESLRRRVAPRAGRVD